MQKKSIKFCVPNFELEAKDLPFDDLKMDKKFDLEYIKYLLFRACGGDDEHRGIVELDLDVVNGFLQDKRECKVEMVETDDVIGFDKCFKVDEKVYSILLIESTMRASVKDITPLCAKAQERDVAFAWLINENLKNKFRLTYLYK